MDAVTFCDPKAVAGIRKMEDLAGADRQRHRCGETLQSGRKEAEGLSLGRRLVVMVRQPTPGTRPNSQAGARPGSQGGARPSSGPKIPSSKARNGRQLVHVVDHGMQQKEAIRRLFDAQVLVQSLEEQLGERDTRITKLEEQIEMLNARLAKALPTRPPEAVQKQKTSEGMWPQDTLDEDTQPREIPRWMTSDEKTRKIVGRHWEKVLHEFMETGNFQKSKMVDTLWQCGVDFAAHWSAKDINEEVEKQNKALSQRFIKTQMEAQREMTMLRQHVKKLEMGYRDLQEENRGLKTRRFDKSPTRDSVLTGFSRTMTLNMDPEVFHPPSLSEDSTLMLNATDKDLEAMDHELFEPIRNFDKDMQEMLIDMVNEKVRRILALDPSKWTDGRLPFGLRPDGNEHSMGKLEWELQRARNELKASQQEKDAAMEELNRVRVSNRAEADDAAPATVEPSPRWNTSNLETRIVPATQEGEADTAVRDMSERIKALEEQLHERNAQVQLKNALLRRQEGRIRELEGSPDGKVSESEDVEAQRKSRPSSKSPRRASREGSKSVLGEGSPRQPSSKRSSIGGVSAGQVGVATVHAPVGMLALTPQGGLSPPNQIRPQTANMLEQCPEGRPMPMEHTLTPEQVASSLHGVQGMEASALEEGTLVNDSTSSERGKLMMLVPTRRNKSNNEAPGGADVEADSQDVHLVEQALRSSQEMLHQILAKIGAMTGDKAPKGRADVENILGRDHFATEAATQENMAKGDGICTPVAHVQAVPAFREWMTEALRSLDSVENGKLSHDLQDRCSQQQDEISRLLLVVDEMRGRVQRLPNEAPPEIAHDVRELMAKVGLRDLLEATTPGKLRPAFERLYQDAIQRIQRYALIRDQVNKANKVYGALATMSPDSAVPDFDRLLNTTTAALSGMWYHSDYVFRRACEYAVSQGVESLLMKSHKTSLSELMAAGPPKEVEEQQATLSSKGSMSSPFTRLPGRRGERPGKHQGCHPLPGGFQQQPQSPRKQRKAQLLDPEPTPFTNYVANLRDARGDLGVEEWPRCSKGLVDKRLIKGEGYTELSHMTLKAAVGQKASGLPAPMSRSLPALPKIKAPSAMAADCEPHDVRPGTSQF